MANPNGGPMAHLSIVSRELGATLVIRPDIMEHIAKHPLVYLNANEDVEEFGVYGIDHI